MFGTISICINQTWPQQKTSNTIYEVTSGITNLSLSTITNRARHQKTALSWRKQQEHSPARFALAPAQKIAMRKNISLSNWWHEVYNRGKLTLYFVSFGCLCEDTYGYGQIPVAQPQQGCQEDHVTLFAVLRSKIECRNENKAVLHFRDLSLAMKGTYICLRDPTHWTL